MLFKNSPEKFWNLIASKYAKSPISDRAAYETKIEKIKSMLSTDNVVLDIGCGTGTQCLDLSNNIKQAIGVDISSKLLAVAEQRKAEREVGNVEFIETSLFDERFKPESFDMVMAFYVLHFFEDIDVVFKRVNELLKPDGLFIFETACMGENDKMTGRIMSLLGGLGLVPKINLLTYRQLETTLEKNGFSLVEKTKFSDAIDEYTLFARKS